MISRNFLYATAVITGIASYLTGCNNSNYESPTSPKETASSNLPYNPDARLPEKLLAISRLADSIQDTLDSIVIVNIDDETKFIAGSGDGTTPTDTVTINLQDPNFFRSLTPLDLRELEEGFFQE